MQETCICGQDPARVTSLLSPSADPAGGGAWSCGRCRHAWRTVPWNDVDREQFFRDAHYTHCEHEEEIKATKIRLFYRFERLASQVPGNGARRMVDFGCAYGNCMEVFRERGWEVLGIEISPTAQKTLDDRNLPWAPSIESAGLAAGSVHALVMADCTYYLPEPVAVLRSVARVMHPVGVLLLRQPTRGGLVRLLTNLGKLGLPKRLALSDRLWLDHVHLFSRRSTTLVLQRAGFADVRFIREKGFQRSLAAETAHRLLRAMDLVTLGRLDLTAAWTVIARIGRTGQGNAAELS